MLLLRVGPINLIKGFIKMPKEKKKKESWVARLKKKVHKHFDKEKKKKKESETARTKQVKERLRKAGLSETDIKRLQGKKKNSSHKKSGGY